MTTRTRSFIRILEQSLGRLALSIAALSGKEPISPLGTHPFENMEHSLCRIEVAAEKDRRLGDFSEIMSEFETSAMNIVTEVNSLASAEDAIDFFEDAIAFFRGLEQEIMMRLAAEGFMDALPLDRPLLNLARAVRKMDISRNGREKCMLDFYKEMKHQLDKIDEHFHSSHCPKSLFIKRAIAMATLAYGLARHCDGLNDEDIAGITYPEI